VGPRAGLDGCGKSRPTEIRSPDRLACSDSLFQLTYSGSAAVSSPNFSFLFQYYQIITSVIVAIATITDVIVWCICNRTTVGNNVICEFI
jgi:hypothetical protein